MNRIYDQRLSLFVVVILLVLGLSESFRAVLIGCVRAYGAFQNGP